MVARREWFAGGVSWRVNNEGGLVATWWPTDSYITSRTFYGYSRREAARLVSIERGTART
jgi:hypothetical protein